MAEDINKYYTERFKNCKGMIFILGPNPDNDTPGSLIRKELKNKLSGQIVKKCGKDSKIEVHYPEDADKKINVDIEAEELMFKDDRTKLIFGVWSKDATGIISEVDILIKLKKTSRKTKIFIDKELWEKQSFVTHRAKLKTLSNVFSNVIPTDFSDKDSIINRAIEIFDAHHKWAAERNGKWPSDDEEY